MARIIQMDTALPPDPTLARRLAAARTFRIGQDVIADGRRGKVKKIDFTNGYIVIACGKRTQRFVADRVEKTVR